MIADKQKPSFQEIEEIRARLIEKRQHPKNQCVEINITDESADGAIQNQIQGFKFQRKVNQSTSQASLDNYNSRYYQSESKIQNSLGAANMKCGGSDDQRTYRLAINFQEQQKSLQASADSQKVNMSREDSGRLSETSDYFQRPFNTLDSDKKSKRQPLQYQIKGEKINSDYDDYSYKQTYITGK